MTSAKHQLLFSPQRGRCSENPRAPSKATGAPSVPSLVTPRPTMARFGVAGSKTQTDANPSLHQASKCLQPGAESHSPPLSPPGLFFWGCWVPASPRPEHAQHQGWLQDAPRHGGVWAKEPIHNANILGISPYLSVGLR